MHVEHPLIREGTVEARLYQQAVLATAAEANTLVVMPTALGKTLIAVLLAAQRLQKYPGSRVLMLAPTKPLVVQHAKSFLRFMKVEEEQVASFTGSMPPARRAEAWSRARVVCATPQVVHNDVIAGRYSLRDVSLLVFDEAHRAVGNYPYAFIAERYVQEAEHPRILALTASPGGEEERIDEVVENLHIQRVEVRTERDPDVRPYIREVRVEWVRVPLPPQFADLKKTLEHMLEKRLRRLRELGIRVPERRVSKRELLELRASVQGRLAREQRREYFTALSLIAGCMNLLHALELLETQGLETLLGYFERIQKETRSKARKELLEDPEFIRVMRKCANLAEEVHHPKLEKLLEILSQEELESRRAIVFTQYRDTVRKLVEELNRVPGIRAVRFVGQASRDSEKGLSQREQVEVLERFRSGEFNVLVATSVAEEGLDIPSVDLVVFYEPIPSEIRAIQRRGRTGRAKAGRVVVLITSGTRDEAFYWSSKHRERKMRGILSGMQDARVEEREPRGKEQRLEEFLESSLRITIDTRELSSGIARELLRLGIMPEPKRLEVGDYVLSSRLCVERKTAEDFVRSIMDRRLFEQAMMLRRSYAKPVIILEGDPLRSAHGLSQNAVRGAIAALSIDLGIPVLITKDEADSAAMIAAMARREHSEGRYVELRGEKPARSLREMQEFIVAGLPGVNTVLARRLLEHFGSVAGVFAASEEELMQVQGIGEKTAGEIRRVIDAMYT
ncbi:MAG: DEAD/DEAH box helicase [Euryarchaeota archaeon]|nr:DEAD/DEAH box helicase [Euryarchaeota archaeon]